MNVEQRPVTGAENRERLTGAIRALSEFYRAFNSRDIEAMSGNWAQTGREHNTITTQIGEQETTMDLQRIRKNIDDLDSMIITLLAKRADLVGVAGRFKKNENGVRDPRRVEQVIEKVRTRAIEKGLDPEIAESVYRTVILCFIDKELRGFSREKRSALLETGGLK